MRSSQVIRARPTASRISTIAAPLSQIGKTSTFQSGVSRNRTASLAATVAGPVPASMVTAMGAVTAVGARRAGWGATAGR